MEIAKVRVVQTQKVSYWFKRALFALTYICNFYMQSWSMSVCLLFSNFIYSQMKLKMLLMRKS